MKVRARVIELRPTPKGLAIGLSEKAAFYLLTHDHPAFKVLEKQLNESLETKKSLKFELDPNQMKLIDIQR